MKTKSIDPQHLVNFTLLKNILFSANLSVSLFETKKMLKSMNLQLQLAKCDTLFFVDFEEVDKFLKNNFIEKNNEYIIDQNYLRKSFLFIDGLYDPLEVFAYRQNTNRKFNKKAIVQKINKKIAEQITDKQVIKELSMWRLWTLDGHNENSEYYYLQSWDPIKQTRSNFHNYSIECDIPIKRIKQIKNQNNFLI